MDAPGIPSRTHFPELPEIAVPEKWQLSVQDHAALDRGPHFDLRLGDTETGHAHSWAIPPVWPKPGEATWAIHQPAHCFPAGTLVATPQGNIPIEDISKGMLVYSLSHTGLLVIRKVTDILKNTATNLVKFDVRRGQKGGNVICTPGHQVYTVKGKVPACLLDGNQPLLIGNIPSLDQQQLLMGILLGDGSLNKQGEIRICHGPKQKRYARYLYTQLKTLGARYSQYRGKFWVSLVCPDPNWHARIYGTKKRITESWLDEMGLRGLAVFYLDDGNRGGKTHNAIDFSTQGFELDDIEIFKNWLKSRWNIDSVYYRSRHDSRWNDSPPTSRVMWRLRINRHKSIQRFYYLIAPYLPTCCLDFGKEPIKKRTTNCLKCNKEISRRRRYCDECLWNSALGIPSGRYDSSERRLAYTHAIYERFGKWPFKKYVGIEPNPNQWIDEIIKKIGVASICSPAVQGARAGHLNRAVQWISYKGPVYNLTVENEHNYVLSVGLVVGNSIPYMDFEGIIPEGTYGAGAVKVKDRAPIEVVRSRPGHITFHVYRGSGPEEYTLHRVSPEAWRFYNRTQTAQQHPALPDDKPKYNSTKIEHVDLGDESQVMSAKIDDAHTLFVFPKGGRVRAFSYRRSANREQGVIEHTHKVPSLLSVAVPTPIHDTILRGGLYAVNSKGESIPSHVLAGLLNANVWKSREKQEEVGHLRPVIYDVVRFKGKDFSEKPYKDKLEILHQVASNLPQFDLPPMAYTEEEKKKLLHLIASEKLPLTKEGVVLWPLHTGALPTKAKFVQDHDIYVREIFPGEGKYTGNAAGGFTYSHSPKGAIVGKVGTGLSDALRKDLLENPKKYVGAVAKVTAQEKFPSGALRAPVFVGWHLDKNENLEELVHG